MGFLSVLTPFIGIGKFVAKEVSDWVERRDALKQVRLEADVAEITAKAEIAAYKVKADVEWDLAWAGQAQSSWKDEYILILWTIPVLAFLPSLFIPGLRESVGDTMTYLQGFHEDIIYWYMAGWGIIFSATFGRKAAVEMMMPGKVAKISEAFAELPADIPEEVAEAAQKKVTGLLSRLRGKRQ